MGGRGGQRGRGRGREVSRVRGERREGEEARDIGTDCCPDSGAARLYWGHPGHCSLAALLSLSLYSTHTDRCPGLAVCLSLSPPLLFSSLLFFSSLSTLSLSPSHSSIHLPIHPHPPHPPHPPSLSVSLYSLPSSLPPLPPLPNFYPFRLLSLSLSTSVCVLDA